MAIFQPSFVTPDVRSGLGLGVIDATRDMRVSWKINGQSALTSFQITIFDNNTASTQKYTTGQITTGCPAYGTSSAGEAQMFSYVIPASSLASGGVTNGGEYKLVIKQWWSADDSVTQSSASVFVTRAAPTLSIAEIGDGGTIDTRYYTFTGNYAQAQGDVLNWFRWRIADADRLDDPLFDSGNVSGTMDISCRYDGFLPYHAYAVRLTGQTESGVDTDTDWAIFYVEYPISPETGLISAKCASGTDAVVVNWGGIGYSEGHASGGYTINANNTATLEEYTRIWWDTINGDNMRLAPPWSVVWAGTLADAYAEPFRLELEDSRVISLRYYPNFATGPLLALVEIANGETRNISFGAIVAPRPRIAVVLTPTMLYLRISEMGGGLYPSETLYPRQNLYPQSDYARGVQKTQKAYYTQSAITQATIQGPLTCDYFEIIQGTASGDTISAVMGGYYTPGKYDADYLLVTWANGINAGKLPAGIDLVGWAIYRARSDEGNVFAKVADLPSTAVQLYDYGVTSQSGTRTYYVYPVGTETYSTAPFRSNEVKPCWWNWTLMECEETERDNAYTVEKAFRFRYNIETGAMTNNNEPNILPNFTPYPKVQIAPQNYKSGSLTALLGAVEWTSGQPKYRDTIDLRDAIYALSTSQKPLFLKNRKGDLLRVRISGAISMKTNDTTREQAQTMTLPWVEVGSAEGVSLYAAEDVSVK